MFGKKFIFVLIVSVVLCSGVVFANESVLSFYNNEGKKVDVVFMNNSHFTNLLAHYNSGLDEIHLPENYGENRYLPNVLLHELGHHSGYSDLYNDNEFLPYNIMDSIDCMGFKYGKLNKTTINIAKEYSGFDVVDLKNKSDVGFLISEYVKGKIDKKTMNYIIVSYVGVKTDRNKQLEVYIRDFDIYETKRLSNSLLYRCY